MALWQTKIANEKKVKLSFAPLSIAIGQDGSYQEQYISLSVSNVSLKIIKIVEFGYWLNNKRRAMINPNVVPIENSSLPCILEPENNLELYLYYSNFVNSLSHCINNKSLKKNSKLYFYVKDCTGKFYTLKTKWSAKSYLQEM